MRDQINIDIALKKCCLSSNINCLLSKRAERDGIRVTSDGLNADHDVVPKSVNDNICSNTPSRVGVISNQITKHRTKALGIEQ